MCRGGDGFEPSSGEQSVIWLEDDTLCLRLLRRKNRPQGSGIMRRKCCCQGNPHICPLHVVWDRFFSKLAPGTKPWSEVSAGHARASLRDLLAKLGVSVS